VAGILILCAGPIGNLADAPPRLGEALGSADLVYAEDTRRARKLLAHLGLDRPLRSYFVGNEESRAVELAGRLRQGETVALVTDAGTPGIADPGVSAVRAAVAAGARITGVPGPSAVTMALAVSGMPADRFVFEGFLPRKGARRARRIGALAAEPRTAVVFCSPARLGSDLADLAAALGEDRGAVVCRELTKLHEEVWRGSLGRAVEHWGAADVRGEVTLVIEGAAEERPDLDAAVRLATRLVDGGLAPTRAARIAAAETGAKRRRVYERLTGGEAG
jgi:16S rRNA (cytidine1402-2'-O)-methyltransferase